MNSMKKFRLILLLMAAVTFAENKEPALKPLFVSAGGYFGSKDCFTVGGGVGLVAFLARKFLKRKA